MDYKKSILKRVGFYEITQCLSKPKRFTEILRESGLNPTTTNRRLYNMMDDGLIEKFIDSTDRKPKYRLTSKGKKYREIIEVTAILEKASKKVEEGGKISPGEKLLFVALTKDKKEIHSAFSEAIEEKISIKPISEKEIEDIFSLALEKISSI